MIKNELKRFSAHTGVILSKLSIVALVITVICALSTVFSVVFYAFALILWFALIILFVGILLLNEDFRTFPTRMTKILDFLNKGLPIVPNVAAVAMIISALSLILMAFDFKWAECKKRYALQVCVFIASVILFAVSFSITASRGQ